MGGHIRTGTPWTDLEAQVIAELKAKLTAATTVTFVVSAVTSALTTWVFRGHLPEWAPTVITPVVTTGLTAIAHWIGALKVGQAVRRLSDQAVPVVPVTAPSPEPGFRSTEEL